MVKTKDFSKIGVGTTLLNVDYNIASAVLSSRIKRSTFDNKRQTKGFYFKGWFFAENVQQTDIWYFTDDEQSRGGLLLLLDFEKGFWFNYYLLYWGLTSL